MKVSDEGAAGQHRADAREGGDYCAIGLVNPKSPENVGAVMRAAGCYGANEVYYTGQRFELFLTARDLRRQRVGDTVGHTGRGEAEANKDEREPTESVHRIERGVSSHARRAASSVPSIGPVFSPFVFVFGTTMSGNVLSARRAMRRLAARLHRLA